MGNNATENIIRTIKTPPRIVHFSTHSFFFSDLIDKYNTNIGREIPLLLSGLALSNANNGLCRKLDENDDDGIFSSLEILNLNLQGTQLVSLSSCQTGKGIITYSEGVYGLIRAFHIAGANSILMTIDEVTQRQAKKFMTRYYETWLVGKNKNNNFGFAEALQETKSYFIKEGYPPKIWSPYILIGI